jgi:anti-sigma factor RsiW
VRNEEQWLEEISARLDGEAHDTALASGPRAEDRARAYAAMGELLRAMPQPEPDAAFVTRVMAQLREEEAPRVVSFAWRHWLAGGALAMAAALAMLLALPREASAPATTELAAETSPSPDEGLEDLLLALAEVEGEAEPLEAEAESEGEAELLTEAWQEIIRHEVYAYVSGGEPLMDEGEML